MLQPEYALVTGATKGLGKAFAQALAARELNLVLVARSKDNLEALARQLRTSHAIQAEPIECDLTAPMAVQNLVQQLRQRELRISLLVNNAGFGARGEFRNLPLEHQLEMIRLNNQAVVELTFDLLPPMIKERRGGIINVASAAGFQPIPYAAVYAATKSFLTSFSLGLAEEVRPYRVTVVTVCPGRIRPDPRTEGLLNGSRNFHGIYETPQGVVRDTLKIFDRGGGLGVPGLVNKMSVFAERLIPRRVVPKLVAKLSRL